MSAADIKQINARLTWLENDQRGAVYDNIRGLLERVAALELRSPKLVHDVKTLQQNVCDLETAAELAAESAKTETLELEHQIDDLETATELAAESAKTETLELEQQINQAETCTNILRDHVYNLDAAHERMVAACKTGNTTHGISTQFDFADATMSN